MNRRIKDLYLLTMYLLSFAGVTFLVFSRINAIWASLVFSLLWLLSFTVRNLFLYNTDEYKKLGLLTYLLEVVFMLSAGVLGAGGTVRYLLCITLADCFIVWGLGYGLPCFFTIVTAYIVQNPIFHSTDVKDTIIVLYNEAPLAIITGLVSYLAGRVLKTGALLESSIKEVEEREVKLRAAYHELSLAYKGLEEMATLKERNRIAREIHDTVGHTLTNVIVELEAGKMIAEKDPKASRGKNDMAHDQAVKALNEMRYSVRMLAGRPYDMDLKQCTENVLEEVKLHSGMAVKSSVEIPSGFKSTYDDLIIRALKEGLSNSIRHGGATAVFFRLSLQNRDVHFLLQDNGIGTECVHFGFGLKSMKEGIEHAGGNIAFTSEPGEGFEIEMSIPVESVGR